VRILGAAAVTTGILALATAAGAAASWSASTGSGPAGTGVRVTSSATSLCRWTVPDAPDDATLPSATEAAAGAADATTTSSTTPVPAAGADVVVDGSEVSVRLGRPEVAVLLGTLDVDTGGAWSGTVTLPDAVTLPPGEYQLIVRCVVDRPDLGAVHSYDFEARPFTVTEAPPPTTVTTVPVEIGEPATATKTEVQGARLDRDTTTAAPTTAAPTLPNTGGSELELGLAGLGSLLVGGAALWWGARRGRPATRVD